jgi:hypothetical protein
LKIPESNFIPYETYVMDEHLYVTAIGKDGYGGVWKFDPNSKIWNQIVKKGKAPFPDSLQGLFVGSIGELNNKLFFNIWKDDVLICWLGDYDANEGELIPCPGNDQKIGSLEMQELDGALYGMSPSDGIFRYKEGATKWDSLPSARGRPETKIRNICGAVSDYVNWTDVIDAEVDVDCYEEVSANELENVVAISAHDDHLIIGYKHNYLYTQGIYRLEQQDVWTHLDPIYMYEDTVLYQMDMMLLKLYTAIMNIYLQVVMVHRFREFGCL